QVVGYRWGEEPPRTAVTSLHNAVSQLRRLLGADVVVTRPPGYVLHVAPDELDLVRFEHLVERAREEEPEAHARGLREALGLWRGEPLADLSFETLAQTEIRSTETYELGIV